MDTISGESADGGVDPQEPQGRAAAINLLLGEIGLSTGSQTRWWNLVGYEELGGRTPTQAWLAGDEEAVRALVQRWYEASIAAQRQAVNSPELMALLTRRLQELDVRFRGDHGPTQRSA